MPDFVERFSASLLGKILRILTIMATPLAILYAFSGPILKSYAADAFEQMLVEQGVDPKAFAEIAKEVKDLSQDNDLIRGDINGLKQQAQRMEITQGAMHAQNTRIEGQIDHLVDALIQPHQ